MASQSDMGMSKFDIENNRLAESVRNTLLTSSGKISS